MRKILILLSLVVIALFVVGCGTGQAIGSKKSIKAVETFTNGGIEEKFGNLPFYEGVLGSQNGSIKNLERVVKKLTTNEQLTSENSLSISVSCPPKKIALSGECQISWSGAKLTHSQSTIASSNGLPTNHFCNYFAENGLKSSGELWLTATVLCAAIE